MGDPFDQKSTIGDRWFLGREHSSIVVKVLAVGKKEGRQRVLVGPAATREAGGNWQKGYFVQATRSRFPSRRNDMQISFYFGGEEIK